MKYIEIKLTKKQIKKLKPLLLKSSKFPEPNMKIGSLVHYEDGVEMKIGLIPKSISWKVCKTVEGKFLDLL